MDAPSPILAVVTDRTRLSPNWALAQACAEAVSGGANLLILAETDLKPEHRAKLAEFLLQAAKGRCPVIALSHAEFAHNTHLHGALVAVPAELEPARQVLGPAAALGVVLQHPADAASCSSADFVLAVLPWNTPYQAFAQLQMLLQTCPAPVVAGLDMTTEQAAECLQMGARGIALCSAAMCSEDRSAELARYAQAIGIPVAGWEGPAGILPKDLPCAR
jgi:thiamine monophosphate synthase